MYNNFEISLVVFMPNITTNHAITNTNSYSRIRLIIPSLISNLIYKYSSTSLYISRDTSLLTLSIEWKIFDHGIPIHGC